jgi:hypothetical protein
MSKLGAFLIGPALCSALSCSSPSESPARKFVLPGSGAGAGGMSEAGGQAPSGAAGGGTGGGSGGSATASCAEPCQGGMVCRSGACVCPTSKPDLCEGVCVALSSDPNNCKTCNTACSAGAGCTPDGCGEAPMPLAATTGCGVIRMAVLGSELYWVESLSGNVLSLPLASPSAVPSVVASGQLSPTGIVVDSHGLYWVNAGDGTPGTSKVMKKALPVSADPATVLVTGAATSPDSDVIRAIALHDDTLLYTLVHDVRSVSTMTAGSSSVVGTAMNYDHQPPEPDGFPSGLVVSGQYVIWSTDQRQGIERDDVTEGAAGYAELGESQGSLLLRDLGTNGTNVYWAKAESIGFCPVTKADGPGNTFLTGTPDFDAITALAVGNDASYFAGEKGQLFRHSLEPASPAVAPVLLARDQLGVSSIVVTETQLIWATVECKIQSLPLP